MRHLRQLTQIVAMTHLRSVDLALVPDDRKRLNLKLPPELHQRAVLLRVRQGLPSLQEWGERAIEREVARQEAEMAKAERKRR